MIEVFALLYLHFFIRQSTTSPPANLNEWAFLIFMTVLVSGGGIALGVKVISDRQKNWMEDQDFRRKEAEAKLNRDNEQSKADVTQDTALSEALVQFATIVKTSLDVQVRTAATGEERNKLQAKQADLLALQSEGLEALGDRIKKM